LQAGHTDPRRSPTTFIRFNLYDVGKQISGDISRSSDLIAIDLAEKGRGIPEDLCNDPPSDERCTGIDSCLVGSSVIHESPELANRVGTFVEWIEVGSSERPAAVRNPVPFLEIDLVKRPTLTTPVVGRTPEIAHARTDK